MSPLVFLFPLWPRSTRLFIHKQFSKQVSYVFLKGGRKPERGHEVPDSAFPTPITVHLPHLLLLHVGAKASSQPHLHVRFCYSLSHSQGNWGPLSPLATRHNRTPSLANPQQHCQRFCTLLPHAAIHIRGGGGSKCKSDKCQPLFPSNTKLR